MPTPTLLQRLKERKLVQWALAYLAGGFVILQILDALETPLGLTATIQQTILAIVVVGFFITLILAWYHGEKGRQRVSGPELLMVAALLVVAGVALSTLGGSEGSPAGPTYTREGDNRPGIAVLPCVNMSADPADAYLATSLHEEILVRLQKISSLFSVGRTSVLPYAENPTATHQIATELGVGFIGECSVRRATDQIRLTFQLLDGPTGGQLLATNYDRPLTPENLFDIQTEIAEAVALALHAELTPIEQSRISAVPTGNTEAYMLFLQGEEYRNRASFLREDLQIAEHFFDRALALDSTFALAFASLSWVHGVMYWLNFDPLQDRLERQRTAAEAAFRLAPDLPQVRWALGASHYFHRDYASALEELTTAVEGLPGSAELWFWLGLVHRRLGHWDQALVALQKATTLDPRDANLFVEGGISFQFLHRYEEATEAFNRASELEPDLWDAELWRARTHLQGHGELDSLRAVLQRGPEDSGELGPGLLWRARLALLERNPEAILNLLNEPQAVTFESQSSYEPGLLYTAWANTLKLDRDRATRAFAGALAQLDSVMVELPDDWRLRASRGLALAGLSRDAEARTEAEWLRSNVTGPFDRADRVQYEAVAMILSQVGFWDEALREIEQLLEGPSMTSVYTLRLDPRFDPIRDDPRFKALLEKYAPEVEHR
ncbi:tetratricopeptide repeat protein [Gemmatimonadota bacterium]